MKYLQQAVIIAAITFAAEIIKYFVPLPVPASIYGLILLFVLLKTGLLKLGQIEDVGGLLLELMPLLLVPASVSFLTVLDTIQGMLLPVLIMGFIGTTVVMIVTGSVSQWIIRRSGKEKGHE
ncbi:MAG: CidA/LrgA family protein [Oscillospiraceae bacterium]|nr:CidA/LrgA family protein [Oscillospiraceae bacterium]